jgi:hypothetical protein
MAEYTLEELLEMPIFSLPIPESPLARCRAFVRALAYGAIQDIWDDYFFYERGNWLIYGDPELFDGYLETKWAGKEPKMSIVKSLGYLTDEESNTSYSRLTEKAYALLEEAPETPIFISYKQSESCSFALLLKERMQNAGLNPFLDVTNIEAGALWEEQLQKEIQNRDVFICLIAKTTLESPWVRREILEASQKPKDRGRIIPVFHNGCTLPYLQNEWLNSAYVNKAVAQDQQEIRKTLAIVAERQIAFTIQEEKAVQYNLAIAELLGIFGV